MPRKTIREKEILLSENLATDIELMLMLPAETEATLPDMAEPTPEPATVEDAPTVADMVMPTADEPKENTEPDAAEDSPIVEESDIYAGTDTPPEPEVVSAELPTQVPPSPDMPSKLTEPPAKKPRAPRKKEPKPPVVAPPADKPISARQAFYRLDFRALDRDLSPEQEQEWNSIYASFRSASIITGTVVGVDEHTLDITGEDGQTHRQTVQSLVIIGYRVKVIIPETEVWADGEENTRYATRSMIGARIDYVIVNVDRENDCAIASRKMAMTKQRRHFKQAGHNDRTLLPCEVILSAPKVLLVNCCGFDLILTQKDLSYTAIADLRSTYKPGMALKARLLGVKDGKPMISVKEVNPNPFDGADQRHPVGCRRQGVIEGKYGGGLFCRLYDDTTCLCLYSNNHYDTDFEVGDMVLIHITRFDYDRKLIYGRIVAKR